MASRNDVPNFTLMNDFACQEAGAGIIFATSDWYGQAEHILRVQDPIWDRYRYTSVGQWMDGWQTKYIEDSNPSSDWCIIKLSQQCIIHGIDVETTHFIGHHTPAVSIQAAKLQPDSLKIREEPCVGKDASEMEHLEIASLVSQKWEEILSKSKLKPGYVGFGHNFFNIDSRKKWTHIRLNMHSSGGIARIRVYGGIPASFDMPSKPVNLILMELGGVCTGVSSIRKGHPRNLIVSRAPHSCEDAWYSDKSHLNENKYKVEVVPCSSQCDKIQSNEWVEFRLGTVGNITKIELDTSNIHKPVPSCTVEGLAVDGKWRTVLPSQQLSPCSTVTFPVDQLINTISIRSVRLNLSPGGALTRLNVWALPQGPVISKAVTARL